MTDRAVSVRRTLEQAGHCIDEARSIVERSEDIRCAIDDVDQAIQLLRENVMPGLKKLAQVQRPQ